jgi:radical SAM protein with 4Fe4S-binding SPASM domain
MDFNLHELAESMYFFKNLGFSIGTNPIKVITRSNDTPEIRAMISEEFYRNVLTGNPSGEIGEAENGDALCRGLQESLMIDIHGDIHPCVTFRNFIVGSIFEELPLSGILRRNEEYMRLRHLSKKDLPCGACEYHDICNPCMALWHTLTGSFEHPNPQNCNLCKAYASLDRVRRKNESSLCGNR